MLVVSLVVRYHSFSLNFSMTINPKSSFSKIMFIFQSFMVSLWTQQPAEEFIAMALKHNSSISE